MTGPRDATGPDGDDAGAVAVVLAGGELPPPHLAEPLLDGADLVVAADGGLLHAATLGLRPHLLVGDLDSVTTEALRAFPDVPVERHPVEKDALDLELALEAARRLGATSARVLGALGGRFDQSLAALLIAARAADEAFRVSLHGGTSEAHLCSPAQSVALRLRLGTTVSLLALGDDAVASASGLAYAVDALRLPFGAGLGVSNAAAEEAVTVSCLAGVVAVVVEHSVD